MSLPMPTGTNQPSPAAPAQREPAAAPVLNRAADLHEIRPLTGVRAFAAFWVVLLHFYPQWSVLIPPVTLTQRLAFRGQTGVDLFFLLSGFILSYVYSTGPSKLSFAEYKRFVGLRVARVYPVHLFTFSVLALLVFTSSLVHVHVEGSYPLRKIPFELTMTHAWFSFLPAGGWNYPSWSISAEWFAYLFIFPITAYLLKLRWRAGALLALGYGALVLWLILLAPDLDYDHWQPWRCVMVRVSCEFIAGAMVFGAFWSSSRFAQTCQRFATLLVLMVLATAAFSPLSRVIPAAALILLFPLMLVGLTSEETLVGRILAHPLVFWGGQISYSLYMSHALVQKVLKVILPYEKYVASPLAVRVLIVFLQLVALIGTAAFLYHLVEVPARNGVRRFLTRRSRPKVGAPSAQ
jgi:peptidoglycan/LPS O-acetylase OafA/YrhL